MDYEAKEPLQCCLYPIQGAFFSLLYFGGWGKSAIFWETPANEVIWWRYSAN